MANRSEDVRRSVYLAAVCADAAALDGSWSVFPYGATDDFSGFCPNWDGEFSVLGLPDSLTRTSAPNPSDESPFHEFDPRCWGSERGYSG